jgi:hypothetical protein
MTAESDDYENGIADVLRAVLPSDCEVLLGEHLPGRSSRRRRQIDALVRGPLLGLPDGLMVVECKRHSRPVDVKIVDSFIGLLGDVEVDAGLMVSGSGFTKGAIARVESERGARLGTISPEELARHTPKGTLNWIAEIPAERVEAALAALRRNRLRAWAESDGFDPESGGMLVRVVRHTGSGSPSGDEQAPLHALVCSVLDEQAPGWDLRSTGITMGGGVAEARWLVVTADGQPTDLKVVAASEREADQQLSHLAATFTFERARLDVERPDGWPAPSFLERVLGGP